jgi:hypothetical protein
VPPAKKTIDLEGRIVKDGVRKAMRDRQQALADLVHGIQEYRRLAEGTPLTLQGGDFAHVVLELNKAVERADRQGSSWEMRDKQLDEFQADAVQLTIHTPDLAICINGFTGAGKSRALAEMATAI